MTLSQPRPTPLALGTLALEAARREFPNQPAHVHVDEHDAARPSELHPVFYGCYDWHSAVHAYWTMTRCLTLTDASDTPDTTDAPDAPHATQLIREHLASHLTPERIALELSYLRRAHAVSFERPYGWAWLFALRAALVELPDDDAMKWSRLLRPLTDLLGARLIAYMERLEHPIRAGTHANTAFALGLIYDSADRLDELALMAAIRRNALAWYYGDRDWPFHYELSGEDFLSPGLCEATLMARVLESTSFLRWWSEFDSKASGLLAQLVPIDRIPTSDGRLMHLAGLNLSRAWMLRDLAGISAEPLRTALEERSRSHLETGLHTVFSGEYSGEHWLATFAMRALYPA